MPPLQQYERVAEDLRARIYAGEYPPGSQLPSRAQLREIYACSSSVIDKAMALLRWAGLTETLAGVGVYVADPLPPQT